MSESPTSAAQVYVAAALMIAAVVLAWLSGRDAPPSARPPDDGASTHASTSVPQAQPSPRRPVPETAPAPASTAPADQPVTGLSGSRPSTEFSPFVAVARVVDGTGAPVPAAEIRYGAVAGTEARAAFRGPAFAGEPRVVLTDGAGIAALTIDRPFFCVEACKTGAGTTGRLALHWQRVASEKSNWILLLRQLNQVHGIVRRADGTPAPGAEIRVHATGGRIDAPRILPDPVRADAEGRFRIELGWDTLYSVRANDGATMTSPVAIDTGSAGGETRTVELHFPGRYAVHGWLLDPQGRPAGGTLRAFQAVNAAAEAARRRSPEDEWSMAPMSIAEDGHYQVLLPRSGAYVLVADSPAHAASTPETVEVTEAQPRVQRDLRLHAQATLRGRVVWEDGEPIAGARITLVPGGSVLSGADRRGANVLGAPPAAVVSDGRGAFQVPGAHPALDYSLRCWPDPARRHLFARQDAVRAGGAEVLVRVPRSLASGYAIALEVVDPAGVPVPAYTVTLVTPLGPGNWASLTAANADDPLGRVTIPHLAHDQRYQLQIKCPGRVWPTQVGITAPAGDVLPLRVQLPELGTLTVKVVDAAGRPATAARASVRYPGVHSGTFLLPRAVDEGGIARFDQLEPGTVEVFCRVAEGAPARAETRVLPGRAVAVEVRLERRE